jgi:hypothetical protein
MKEIIQNAANLLWKHQRDLVEFKAIQDILVEKINEDKDPELLNALAQLEIAISDGAYSPKPLTNDELNVILNNDESPVEPPVESAIGPSSRDIVFDNGSNSPTYIFPEIELEGLSIKLGGLGNDLIVNHSSSTKHIKIRTTDRFDSQFLTKTVLDIAPPSNGTITVPNFVNTITTGTEITFGTFQIVVDIVTP